MVATIQHTVLGDDIQLNEDDDDQHKPNGIQKVSTHTPNRTLRDLITAEPVIICFMLATGLHDPAIKMLTYRKVCYEEYNSSFICENLHNETLKDEENEVQSQASHWFLYQHLCFEIPSILMSFFYGAISDHFSRRVALALPCFGQVLSVANYMFNAIYMESHVAYILIGHVISGLFGGWVTCLLGSYSLISEMSTKSNRTFRISIGEGVESVSMAIAFFFSGIILEASSYTTIFSLALGIYTLGIIYCFTWLKVPPRQQKESVSEACTSVFNVQRVKGTLTCVFKKRENNGRTRLLTLMCSIFFGMVSFYAVPAVAFLFLKRRPLSWSQTMYGIFISTGRIVSGLSSLLLIPSLKTCCAIKDTTLLMIGLFSSSVSELFLGFSTKTWMVFMVPFIGLFNQAKYTCYRSLMSQLVAEHELGQMFAFLGSLQSLSGMAGTSLYNSIYPLTLDFWPGFCFSLGVMISVIPLGLTWWLHRDLKKSPVYDSLTEMEGLSDYGAMDNTIKPVGDKDIRHRDYIDIGWRGWI